MLPRRTARTPLRNANADAESENRAPDLLSENQENSQLTEQGWAAFRKVQSTIFERVQSHNLEMSFYTVAQPLSVTPVQGNTTPAKASAESRRKAQSYRVAEVAEQTLFSPQYINLLITRYRVIQPRKTLELNGRESYEFSEEDIATLKRVRNLMEGGIPVRAAAFVVRREQVSGNGDENALGASAVQNSKLPTWRQLLGDLGQNPLLTKSERAVLMLVEEAHKDPAQCAEELGLKSEREARTLLKRAHAKIGALLLQLVRDAHATPAGH